jgi:hypothetical protein
MKIPLPELLTARNRLFDFPQVDEKPRFLVRFSAYFHAKPKLILKKTR